MSPNPFILGGSINLILGGGSIAIPLLFMYEVIMTLDNSEGGQIQVGNKALRLSLDDALYILKQKESMPYGKGWKSGFPEIVNHTGSHAASKDPNFKAAKSGDYDAAVRLVDRLLKPDKVADIVNRYSDASLVYVHMKNQENSNMIPAAFASKFRDSGMKVEDDIVVVTKAKHTGASDMLRLLRRSRFEGDVSPGRNYVLADDFVTSGAEVRDLKDYIESNGGNVVCVTSFGHGSYSNLVMSSTAEQHRQLRQYGLTDKDLCKYGIASRIENLSFTEACKFYRMAKSRCSDRIEEGSAVYQRLIRVEKKIEDAEREVSESEGHSDKEDVSHSKNVEEKNEFQRSPFRR